MSGACGSANCPKCGGEAMTYGDWKPVPYDELTCFDCGYHYYTKVEESYLTEEELDQLHQDWEYGKYAEEEEAA